ncbi:hypothetical protein EB796_014719 [Bugula neritina]|uniref:Uncharacterized protein n=1 Tax=Bugula neritina TaxID=10212 RepID=A0A7J7JNF8_BUGNE|nr:hypothetical protein EB796_014719 [Bugula neritina]
MASRKHAIQCNVDNTGLSVDQVAKLLEVDDLSKAPHCHLTLRLSIFKLMPTLINLRSTARTDTFNKLESSKHFGDSPRKVDLSLLPARTISSTIANMPMSDEGIELPIDNSKTAFALKANILPDNAQTGSNNAANSMRISASKYTSLALTKNLVDCGSADSLSQACKANNKSVSSSLTKKSLNPRNAIIASADSCSNDVALPKRVFALETPTSAHTNKLVVYNKDDSLLQTLKANNNEVGNSINENTTSLRNAIIEHFNSFNDKAIPSCLEHKSTVEGLHGNTPMDFGASKTRFPALAYKLVDCTWDDPLSEAFKAINKAESLIVEKPFDPKNMNIDLVHPRNNLVPRLQDYQSNDKKSRVDATVPNCASEMPSSADTNNPVDYSWYDTISQAFKTNVKRAENLISENTFYLRNVNSDEVDSFKKDAIPTPPAHQSTAEGLHANASIHFGASEPLSLALTYKLVDRSWDDPLLKEFEVNTKADSSIVENVFDPKNVNSDLVDSFNNLVPRLQEYQFNAKESQVNAPVHNCVLETPSSAHTNNLVDYSWDDTLLIDFKETKSRADKVITKYTLDANKEVIESANCSKDIVIPRLHEYQSKAKNSPVNPPMQNSGSETSSSAHTNSPVDHSWCDTLAEAFKANVKSAESSISENTFHLRNENSETADSSKNDFLPKPPKYSSTAEGLHVTAAKIAPRSVVNSCTSEELYSISQSDEYEPGIPYRRMVEIASEMARNGEIPGLLDFQSFNDRPTVQNDDLERPKYNARSALSQMTSRLPNTAHTCSKVVETPLHVRASEPTSSAHTNNIVDYSWDDTLLIDFKETKSRADKVITKYTLDAKKEVIESANCSKDIVIPRLHEYQSKAKNSPVNPPMQNSGSETSSSAHTNSPVDHSWCDTLAEAFKANVKSAESSISENTFYLRNENSETADSSKDDFLPKPPKYSSTAEGLHVTAAKIAPGSVVNSCTSEELYSISQSDEYEPGIPYRRMVEIASEMARNGEIPGLLDFQSFDDRPTVQNDDLERPKYNARSALSQMTSRLPNTAHTCSKVVETPLHVRASEPTSSAYTNNIVDYSWDDTLLIDFKETKSRADKVITKYTLDAKKEVIESANCSKDIVIPRLHEYQSKAKNSPVNPPMQNSGSETSSSAHTNSPVDHSWCDTPAEAFKADVKSAENSISEDTFYLRNENFETAVFSKDDFIPKPREYLSTAEGLHLTAAKIAPGSVVNSCTSEELCSVSQSDEDEPGIPYRRMVEIASEMARNGEIPGLLDFQSFDDRPTVQNDDLERPKYNARSTLSQMTSRLLNTAHTCSKVVETPLHVRASEPTSSAHTNNLIDYNWDDTLLIDFKETKSRADKVITKYTLDAKKEVIESANCSKDIVIPRLHEYQSKVKNSPVNPLCRIVVQKRPLQLIQIAQLIIVEGLHATAAKLAPCSVVNSCTSEELCSISQSDEDEPGIPYRRMVEIASEMARNGEIPGLLDFQSFDDRPTVQNDDLERPKYNARSAYLK